MKWIRVTFLCFFPACIWSAPGVASQRQVDEVKNTDIDFIHYKASIEPSLELNNLSAEVDIEFQPLVANLVRLRFSAEYKQIKTVRLDGKILPFQIRRKQLIIRPRQPLKQEQSYVLSVAYQAAPEKGFQFHPDHMFSAYHTQNWLIAHDALNDKASFELLLRHPLDMESMGNGQLLSQTTLEGGKGLSHWKQQTPIPVYTFGFALGKFNSTRLATAEAPVDVYYRPTQVSELTEPEIKKAFEDVGDIISFMQDKAGFALSNQRYAYMVVAGSMAQEADGYSLVGEKFVKTLLENPEENWFIVHEIAHEWWGNSITCANLSHFWLNEGLVQFMVAAYQQHRFGESAYTREMELARQRVARAEEENRVGPVAYRQVIELGQINRTMVYSRGAQVFNQLRHLLGDEVFWLGIKAYSQQYQGQTVTTDDLRRTLEQVSQRDLEAFFEQWVYGT